GVDAVGHGRDQDFGGFYGRDQIGLAHRNVIDVEARVEQFAHPHLDPVGELARDNDERSSATSHSSAFVSPRRSGGDSTEPTLPACGGGGVGAGEGTEADAALISDLRHCSTLLNPLRRHCRKRDKRGVGLQDAILLYQMTRSRQSIARNGMERGSLRSRAALAAPVERFHAARGDSAPMRPVTMFAHLLTGFIRPLLVAQMVVQLAAVPVSRTARAANDQSEGSGLPLPRFASLKSDHVNVRGGPNRDHDVAWIYTRPALPVEITAEYEN